MPLLNIHKSILVVLACNMVLVSCQNDIVNPQTNKTPDKTANPTPQPEVLPKKPRPPIQESKTVSSTNNFAYRLFAAICSEQQNKNVFISPLSIFTVLTMAFNGANGTTKEAIRQTLDFGSQPEAEINPAFKDLQKLL